MRINRVGGYPIWHIHFSDQYTLAMTFLRMQEHYESPRFRGKIFTLEEYMDWYVKERGGFTYPKDWVGFNVPSWAVEKVYGCFSNHSQKEVRLFEALERRGVLHHEPYYLIGTFGEDDYGLDHEICHGRFFCDPEYRRQVMATVRKYRLTIFRRWLASTGGYAEAVHVDEIQAYALTGYPKKMRLTKEMCALRSELKEIVETLSLSKQ